MSHRKNFTTEGMLFTTEVPELFTEFHDVARGYKRRVGKRAIGNRQSRTQVANRNKSSVNSLQSSKL